MQPRMLGLVGLVCLLACPILIVVVSTAILDLLGVGVGLVGVALVVAALVRGRRAP